MAEPLLAVIPDEELQIGGRPCEIGLTPWRWYIVCVFTLLATLQALPHFSLSLVGLRAYMLRRES
jgi:hypothetical protein